MQLTFTQVTALAAGRWEQIHRSLGVALTTTSHQKHTPCPGCGGKDRFRVTKAYHDTGGFICGGSGDTTGGDTTGGDTTGGDTTGGDADGADDAAE